MAVPSARKALSVIGREGTPCVKLSASTHTLTLTLTTGYGGCSSAIPVLGRLKD